MDTPKGHRPLKPRLCRSPQLTPARLARQVWCSGWKALEQVKRTEDVIENTGSWKNNMRVRIWIEGNARGRTLRFVFGPRRRRRLTARVIPLGSLAELSALGRRVFCSVAGLTGEAASWDTQLPTPSTLLSEEGTCLRSFVDPDFALRLLKEEGSLDSSSGLPSLTFARPRRRICLVGQGGGRATRASTRFDGECICVNRLREE